MFCFVFSDNFTLIQFGVNTRRLRKMIQIPTNLMTACSPLVFLGHAAKSVLHSQLSCVIHITFKYKSLLNLCFEKIDNATFVEKNILYSQSITNIRMHRHSHSTGPLATSSPSHPVLRPGMDHQLSKPNDIPERPCLREEKTNANTKKDLTQGRAIC